MRKFFGSLCGGLLIGLSLALWWIGYEGITYSQLNVAGVEEVIVHEMDFDFVFYSSLVVAAISILIYLIWSLIDNKREERYSREFHHNSK